MTTNTPQQPRPTPRTSGPWAVSKKHPRRVTTTHGVVICTAVLRNRGTAEKGIKQGAKLELEAEANARLIANAPEMEERLAQLERENAELLEALEWAVNHLHPDAEPTFPTWVGEMREMIDRIKKL
jgi:hypothetical protein